MLTGLHLLLTYRCTHECDHCFVYSSPRAQGTFSLARIGQALDQAADVGTVKQVYFEGGEPFLYYPLLLAGLAAARDRGFETGVVTNAFWAETVADAEVWLRPLRDLGVGNVSVSDDAFHHGPNADTPGRRALEAAQLLGMQAGAIRVPAPEEGAGVRFRGRAADTLASARPRAPWDSFRACPDEDLRAPERVHLDSLGNVHLCQGLLLGNAWESPLVRLLAQYAPESHPICGPLLRNGPAGLAREHGSEHEEDYVSACHLCYRMRAGLLDRFPDELGPRQVYGGR